MPPSRGELGCAGVVATVSLAVIGLAAVSFTDLPDVGRIGAAWPWMALLIAGAIGPVLGLATIGRRSRWLTIGLTLWMLVAVFASTGLAINAGGGV